MSKAAPGGVTIQSCGCAMARAPNDVLANGKAELHAEGFYSIEWYENGQAPSAGSGQGGVRSAGGPRTTSLLFVAFVGSWGVRQRHGRSYRSPGCVYNASGVSTSKENLALVHSRSPWCSLWRRSPSARRRPFKSRASTRHHRSLTSRTCSPVLALPATW